MAMTVEQLKAQVQDLLTRARDPKTSAKLKQANLAEAAAYMHEINITRGNLVPFDLDRVNDNINKFMTVFTSERNKDQLGELASLSADDFGTEIKRIENTIDTYAVAEEFGLVTDKAIENSLDPVNESIAYSRKRAGSIYSQMDRTWRLAGSSAEYKAAAKAMQNVSNMEHPTKADQYEAGETVKKYVSKNLKQAYSDVGKTRMACSLAFLKQTMPEANFRAYCAALNMQRGIKSTIVQGQADVEFDKTDPRCFVPEEIGTVKEVYDSARERISELAKEGKQPAPRDLAILTALKSLQAKSTDGENLIVEHEALQAEIEKVQKDPRFQEVLKRPADELVEMAWGHNLDTIDGYGKGLTAEQQKRIDGERKRIADEERQKQEEIKRREEKIRLEKEEAERKLKEEAERLKKEQEEKERLAKEQEAREQAEREFRKNNPFIFDVYQEITPTVTKYADLLESEFAKDLNTDVQRQKSAEVAATLIVLRELEAEGRKNGLKFPEITVNRDDLQKRVDAIKNEPYVKSLGRMLQEDTGIRQVFSGYKKMAKKEGYDGDLYAVAHIAQRLKAAYDKHNEDVKLKEKLNKGEVKVTVDNGYRFLDKTIGQVIDLKVGYKNSVNDIATAIALHEKERQLGGTDKLFDMRDLKKRVIELRKDPLVEKVSQNWTSPSVQDKKWPRAMNMQTDRTRTFAAFVDGMYQDLVAERDKKNAPAEAEKKAEGEEKQNIEEKQPEPQIVV